MSMYTFSPLTLFQFVVTTIPVPGMGDSISEGTIEEFVKSKYNKEDMPK